MVTHTRTYTHEKRGGRCCRLASHTDVHSLPFSLSPSLPFSFPDSIRYLSLHDNKYLRYFKGHRGLVKSLSMSPLDDSFLSASQDRTVRLWDLRTNVCQAMMNIPEPPTNKSNNSGKILVAHDPAGMVFAVATSPNIIKLFDSRAHDSGPFVTFDVTVTRPSSSPTSSTPSASAPSYFSWSSLKFSPDGKDLLVATTESIDTPGAGYNPHYTNQIMLVDSYEGSAKQVYTGHEVTPPPPTSSAASGVCAPSNWSNLPFEASFSPDGAFVFAGSRAGSIHSWHTISGEPVAIWNGLGSTAPITAVQFSPNRMNLVSADANGQMLWWTPTPAAIAASNASATQNHQQPPTPY